MRLGAHACSVRVCCQLPPEDLVVWSCVANPSGLPSAIRLAEYSDAGVGIGMLVGASDGCS